MKHFKAVKKRKLGFGAKTAIVLILLIFLSACLFSYARWIEPNLLTVRSLTVTTGEPIVPCKIVFFTDTHFGKFYPESNAQKIKDKVNELNADIIIFGGDLLDNYSRDQDQIDLDDLASQLSQMEATAGKFAVWGNHDYGGGAVRIYEEFLASCGFTVLKNESYDLEEYGITLMGYDDYLMGWTDPSFYKLSDQYQVLISHEPIVCELIESSSNQLLLSGHTHGGQVTIPFLSSQLLPSGSGEYRKGRYSIAENGTDMYVSSGIGMTRYPFRFLNTPEIVEIILE